MSIFSKKAQKQKSKYGKILPALKICAPILKAMYYVLIVAVLIVGIVALIMPIVNTPVEGIMLPPFMSVHGEEYYSITIGNGIRIDAPYEDVSLGDVKTVIYAELMMLASVFCILAPTFLFLSKLFKNVATGGEYDAKNPRYVMYIALTVMIGSTFVRVMKSVYNYLLVRTFVPEPETVHFAFGVDLGGIATGVLIFVLACIYGQLIEKHNAALTLPTEV